MDKQTILIPLDGSAFSSQILPSLSKHFPPERYQLALLRVAKPVAASRQTFQAPILFKLASSREEQQDLESDINQQLVARGQALDEQMAHLKAELEADLNVLIEAGYGVDVAIHFGEPATEIARLSQQQAVDLIAMATHGRTGLNHLLMGSVAEHIIRQVRVPVLLLRPTSEHEA